MEMKFTSWNEEREAPVVAVVVDVDGTREMDLTCWSEGRERMWIVPDEVPRRSSWESDE